MAGIRLVKFLVICMVCLRGVASSSQHYVAIYGEDRDHCGHTEDTPCKTLAHVISHVSENDVIWINAKKSDENLDWLCEPLILNTSVKLIGYNGVPVVGCDPNSNKLLMLNISWAEYNSSYEYEMENIHFSQVLVQAENSSGRVMVTMTNVIMDDAKWMSHPSIPVVGLKFIGSEWRGSMDKNCTVNCKPTGIIDMNGQYLQVLLQDSTFLHTKLAITSASSVDFEISGCHFSNVPNMQTNHGEIYLTIGNSLLPSRVQVTNSIFENQEYNDPIQSIMNLYFAALMVRAATPPGGGPEGGGVVNIENCIFRNNERGLTLIGPFNITAVQNCSFVGNIAMHAGAAILYLTDPSTPSYVTNCSFRQNDAGSYKMNKIDNYEDSFQIIGDEVRIQSECCKGLISFVGKGGAIRIQRGNLSLKKCEFVNNTARLLGGAVFVDRESTMRVDSVYFENSPIERHALQGDLIYSNGLVSVRSANLMILTAMNHMTLVRHSGDHWSIEVSDIAIQCPVGYRLRVTNTSAYGVTPVGLRRSYKLDQLSYFCESCPRHRYSLDYGYLNYSLTYSSFAYYTLLINGEEPETAYTGSYQYQDIDCQQCPYGGKCQQGITAVANFWGYIYQNQVRFQHCPKGYCCSDKQCESFSTCAIHRTGRLCGSCEDGFSEALFSSQCVRDDNCDATWLWPLAIGSGFLYALFLLYQKDVRDLMFFNPVNIKEIHFPWRSQQVEYQMNNINHHTPDPLPHYRNKYGLKESEDVENWRLDSEIAETNIDEGVLGIENNNVNNKHENDGSSDEDIVEEPVVDTGASFLIILFYYFQDAQLLHIKTVFAEEDNKTREMFKEILSGLFKFRVEIFQFMDKVCFIAGLTPTHKLLIQVILVPYVLLLFGLIYLAYRCINGIRCKDRQGRRANGIGHKLAYYSHAGIEEHNDKNYHNGISTHFKSNDERMIISSPPSTTDEPPKKKFSSKLATGFVLSLLFTYQKLATTSFTLLNCVPVGEESVLYIQGTITCYSMWQYGVIVYTVSCIVPFCLVLLIGPGLLKDGIISLPQFFMACLLPLPFLLHWCIIRLKLRGHKPQVNFTPSDEAQAIMSILQGPFKDSESKLFGPICGAGVLVFRRLILILLFTFVNDTLIRMLCMMLVCFIMLLHHVHVLPYKDTRGNIAGSTSVAALLLVGGINLVRAGFEAAEYTPQGPNKVLMNVFDHAENVLMLWFPAAIMGFAISSMTFKLGLMLLHHFFRKR